jgi:glycosyltransferase involved in cell wall biosynthesis
MKRKASVVIPVYNDAANLEKCLQSIYDTEDQTFEVIVVDDGSSEDLSKVAELFPCKLLRLPSNQGQACARNEGVRQSEGDIILFTDSDCRVMKDWVKRSSDELISAYDKDQRVAAIVSQLRSPKGYIEMSHAHTGYAYVQSHQRYITDYLNTSGMAVLKNAFQDVGGFSEDMRNGEDPELGLKLMEQGNILIFEPSVWVFHNHGVHSFKKMVLKHRQWGQNLGLSLMQKHPKRFKYLLPLLGQPFTHGLLIIPLALATTIKIAVNNFKSDKNVLWYFPCIFINKIFFRWGIFQRSLKLNLI